LLDDHCYLSEIANLNSFNVLHKKPYCNVFINAIMAISCGNVQMGDDCGLSGTFTRVSRNINSFNREPYEDNNIPVFLFSFCGQINGYQFLFQ